MRARGKWRGGLEWDGMAWHGMVLRDGKEKRGAEEGKGLG